jgi:hypothetical protein
MTHERLIKWVEQFETIEELKKAYWKAWEPSWRGAMTAANMEILQMVGEEIRRQDAGNGE